MSEEPPPYRLDRIAGALMLVGFVAIALYGYYADYQLRNRLAGMSGEYAELFSRLRGPYSPLSGLVGVALQVWCSLGVARGRAWAFVLGPLVFLPKIVPMVVYLVVSGYEISSLVLLLFLIPVVSYCALRFFGRLGPRPSDRYGLRDDDPGESFGPDRLVGRSSLVLHAGFAFWALAAYGQEWLRAMPKTSLTLPEHMGAGGWVWLIEMAFRTALLVWMSLGVLRGRGWAFVLGAFIEGQRLTNMVEGRVLQRPSAPLYEWFAAAFYLAFFLYCGLRAFGNLGPRTGDRLALRDANAA